MQPACTPQLLTSYLPPRVSSAVGFALLVIAESAIAASSFFILSDMSISMLNLTVSAT